MDCLQIRIFRLSPLSVDIYSAQFSFRLPLAGLICWAAFLATGQAQTPATVTLSNLVQTYTGTPKNPTVTTTPANLPTQVTYRDLSPTAPAPVSEVVYNDSPDPLELSYSSAGFAAGQLSALGNLVQIAGTARKLESCEVILVTWAKAANYTTWIAANPSLATSEGWFHPITISLFEINSANQPVFLTGETQNILIPWRPLTKPDGSPYPFNGYAFRATIPFPDGATLPERVMVVVSFRTQSYGFDPNTFQPSSIGIPGPYNELNVAYQTSLNVAAVGNDVDPNIGLLVKAGAWQYPATIPNPAVRYPMVRIRALSTATITAPVNVGSWQASARVTNPSFPGSASNTLTIQPATATIQLDNLTQIFDGSPKPVTIVTDPPNLATSVTYNLSSTPPSALGTYTVQVQTIDPNCLFTTASGELSLIGHSLASWLNPWVLNNQIPASATGDDEDPDQDAIPNLVEYALGLDPSTANHGLPNQGTPQPQYSPGQISLVYRKNLSATDLNFQVELASELGGIESWLPAIATEEVLTTVGPVQTIRASMTLAPNDSRRFMRLKIVRQTSP